MREYHKISTVFERATDGTKQLIRGKWTSLELEYLAGCNWVWTEKVDGTNIRIHWDGHRVEIGGRTDRAQIPNELVSWLMRRFGGSETEELLEQLFGEKDVILFGEGYGRKIQGCGSKYIPDGVSFILFDVQVGDSFLPRKGVEDIATSLGVDAVPIVLVGTVFDAIDTMFDGLPSRVAKEELIMEGLVGHPTADLRGRDGKRIIVKVKYKDFGGAVR